MPASPEATGGVGYTFEDSVVAFYLTSLLVQGGARGISEAIIETISLQRAALDEPLDDLIILASDRYGQPAKMSLQVKQSPIISAAETNHDFRAVVTACWEEFRKPEFRHGKDRVGLAAANIAAATLRAARATLDWSRVSVSADDFFRRIATEGFASDLQRKFVADVRSLLPEEARDDETTWNFLKHFVILVFDTLSEGASSSFEAVERLRSALPSGERIRAQELWGRLCLIARQASGVAGSFSRTTLIEQLSGAFELTTAPSRRHDLEKISEETRFALQSIRNDLSGIVIPRAQILKKIDSIDKRRRFIQLAGEAGSGKSAVLRAMAEEHVRGGFALVLTDKRLAGPGWAALATQLRLETGRLDELLLELTNSENPTLYIDGIDRLGESARQTILDIITTLLDDPRLKSWRIVASARSSHLEDLRVWLPPQLVQENQAYVVEVDGFDDTEANIIAESFPAMRDLLFAEGQEREIARRPFFAEVLSRRTSSDDEEPNFFSEISLAQVWLEGSKAPENKALAIERRTALGQLGERCAQSPDRTTSADNLPVETLSELIRDRAIIEVAGSNRYAFAHDIYHEWAVFGLCRQNGRGWPTTLMVAGDRPGLIRIVELLSQFEFETGEDWTATQVFLEQQESWKHWSRAWLIAPFSSPSFFDRHKFISDFLIEDERLIRLLSSFRAYKTIENLLVVHGTLDLGKKSKFERFRIADYLSCPRPVRAWQRMLVWLIAQEWKEETVGDVLETFDVWLNLFQDYPNKIKDQYAMRLDKILADLDAYDYSSRQENPRPLGYLKDGFDEKLRQSFLRATLTNTDLLEQRLRLWSADRVDEKIQKTVFEWATRLAGVAPAALADFSYLAFISSLPSESAERSRGHMIGWSPDIHDWDAPGINYWSQNCHPASPKQQPFAALFDHAPKEGLRLVRQLLTRTVVAWKELPQYDYRNQAVPLPITIRFPWGEQEFWGDERIYGWYRGSFASDALASALMALEDWAFSELEAGRETDEIVKDLVVDHNSVATLGIALGILLENVTTSPAAAALVGCQHIWVMDEYRCQHDSQGLHSNEIGTAYGRTDETVHLEALKRINARPTRAKNIRWLASTFMLTSTDGRQQLKEKLEKFPLELPFTHEGQEANEETVELFRKRADEWAAMADLSSYAKVATDDGRIGVAFQPSEDRLQQADEAGERLAFWNAGFLLLKQAEACFKARTLTDEAREEMLLLAWDVDSDTLFSEGFDAGDPASRRAEGVAAAAAAILNFGSNLEPAALEWATSVAFRAAINVVRSDNYFHADTPVDDRPETFAAKALAAIVRKGGSRSNEAKEALILLCFNPYKGVQKTAFESAASCWREEKSFSDEIVALAFKLVVLDRGTHKWRKTRDERQEKLDQEKNKLFKVTRKNILRNMTSSLNDIFLKMAPEHLDEWRIKDFVSIVPIIPKERFESDSTFRENVLQLLRSFVANLSKAIELAEGVKRQSSSRLSLEFAGCVWSIATLCDGLPPKIVQSEIIPLLSQLPTGPRSKILSIFANAYSCLCILDANEVTAGTIDVFLDIFEAVADDPDWKRHEWRDDYGIPEHLSKLVHVAMGGNWDSPATGASRFANEDWRDAAILDPLIDWMLQRFGHLPEVMQSFLLHVERSFDHRNGKFLATRLGTVAPVVWRSRGFWSGGRTVQLAGLLQSFAEREAPMSADIHAQFLEILDHLVEFGDRRSAALQMSSLFDLPRGVTTAGYLSQGNPHLIERS